MNSFSPLKITPKFELIAGATVLIPINYILTHIYSPNGNFPDILIEGLSADGWEALYDTTAAAAWTPNDNVWNVVPTLIISDGVRWRLRNSGVNPVPGIQYFYMEVQ